MATDGNRSMIPGGATATGRRGPGCLMLLPLLLAWLGQAAVARAADAGDDPLAGRWRGVVTGRSAPASAPKEITAVIEPAAEAALGVRWRTLDGEETGLRLERTAREGVLAPSSRGSGLQAMLGGSNGERAAPLEGEPLLWARRDARGLYIYRLTIADDGGLTLDRYGFEPVATPAGRLRFTAARVGPDGVSQGELRAELAREER